MLFLVVVVVVILLSLSFFRLARSGLQSVEGLQELSARATVRWVYSSQKCILSWPFSGLLRVLQIIVLKPNTVFYVFLVFIYIAVRFLAEQ